ncbi:hypothetical protein BV20DRAFT_793589 [Pilatotrama ljubarskyi]|nr:hypothetical protein BV20DRAFT_793589 [Pilatotrama ljubarskyi]
MAVNVCVARVLLNGHSGAWHEGRPYASVAGSTTPERVQNESQVTMHFDVQPMNDHPQGPWNSVTVTIDNADPSIEYSGLWIQVPSSADPDHASFDGTLAATNVTGASATVRFNATKVIVYGALLEDTGTIRAKFTLDDEPPQLYEQPIDNTGSASQFRVKLWQSSGNLTSDGHTLQIANEGDAFFLDYLQFEVPDSRVIVTSDSSTIPSTAPTSSSALSSSLTDITQVASASSLTTPTMSPFSFSRSTSLRLVTSMRASSESSESSSTLPLDGLLFSSSSGGIATVTFSPPTASVSTSTAPLTSDTPQAAAQPTKGRSAGLTSGGIAGVAVGTAVAVQLVLLAVFCMWRRRWAKVKSDPAVGEPSDGRGANHRSMEQLFRSSQAQRPPNAVPPREGETDAAPQEPPEISQMILPAKSDMDRAQGRSRRSARPSSLPTVSSLVLSYAGSSGMDNQQCSVTRRTEIDGGIRLAGGPPGQEVDPAPSHWVMDAPPDLSPPPYRRDYGSSDGQSAPRPDVRRCST